MRIVRKSPIVLVNLVMFVIHLVMPIVIITTWKGYYDIRVYSQYSGEPKYEKCAKKDIYTDDYHVIDKWCQGYRGTPVSFAHGDVHTSCILFWVIAYVPRPLFWWPLRSPLCFFLSPFQVHVTAALNPAIAGLGVYSFLSFC